MSFEQLGPYLRVGNIIETSNALLFDVQGPDANIYFAKVPKNLDASSSAARQFSSVARHLKKINSDYINKVIDSGEDAATGMYFMILEKIENAKDLDSYVQDNIEVTSAYLKKILHVWYNCVEALDLAASKNIFHKDVHPRNILISESGKPIIIDFGISILEHTISRKPADNEYANKFAAPEYIKREESKLQSRTDIYSLSLTILYALLGHKLFYEVENNGKRLERVLELYRALVSIEGVSTFKEVFEKCFDSNPNNRYFRYSELRDAINNLFEKVNHTPEKPVAIFFEQGAKFDQFVREINSSGLYIAVNEHRHPVHKTVRAKLATENFFVNLSYVSNKGNCLEIKGLKERLDLEPNEHGNHRWVIEKGYLLSGVNFRVTPPWEASYDQVYDVYNLFEKLFIDKNEITRSPLPKQPKNILSAYKTLLEEEINYLRGNAFKIRYSGFEADSSSDACFKVVLDQNMTADAINNFLKRSQAAFRSGTELVLFASEDADGQKRRQKVGFTIKFDRSAGRIYMRDFPIDKAEEVPANGFLIEDTLLLEVQYRRQLNAIKNYENGSTTNAELRKYLFQPKNLTALSEDAGELNADLEVISRQSNGEAVQFQEAQKYAILKSLYRPPITIIQGPPGTGKTTVITEIIRQILAKDRQAKILITSQTNLAVDNVLSRMVNVENVSFIRLGRNVDDVVIENHTFDKKLNLWAKKTKSNSDKHFNALRKTISAKRFNDNPFTNILFQELNKKQSWTITKDKVKQHLSGHFVPKELKALAAYLDSKVVFEEQFSMAIGGEAVQFNKLEQLKRKWSAILSNIENKDELKSKFVSSLNIVGATANHIAARMYSDFKFEFDYVIMDEAAKATPAETLVPLNMAHNIILVGDHQQLPPLVTATDSVKKQIEERLNTEGEMIDFDKVYYDEPSLFEIMFNGAPEDFKEMLDFQFRMPQQIGDIVSELVYENRLKSTYRSGKPHNINLKAATSMFMIDTGKYPDRHHKIDPISRSSYNEVNAKVVINLLRRFDSMDNLFDGTMKSKPYEIGVITGYGKQAEYLVEELKNTYFKNLVLNTNLVVATVDSFQGSEKDIIIYDVVRSSKPSDPSGLGFLEMPNRINVALTRVTRLMAIVGDANYLLSVNPSKRWVALNKNKPILLKDFVHRLHIAGFIYNDINEIMYE